MENKLERLERLAMPDELHKKECERLGIGLTEDYDILKAYFESIDNVKPSKVLASLESMKNRLIDAKFTIEGTTLYSKDRNLDEDYNTIKQVLIKAQEQEKENVYIEKIKTMMKQKDCVLRYIESEDCFAVKTILSDGWYKLTPELVENNVREEIKSLPLIEKNKQLKMENDKLKKILDIIREKTVDIALLNDCEDRNEYNMHFPYREIYQLTQEEFNLLKEWLKSCLTSI